MARSQGPHRRPHSAAPRRRLGPVKLDSWISPKGEQRHYNGTGIPHFGALLLEIQDAIQAGLSRRAAAFHEGTGVGPEERGDLYQLHQHARRRRRRGQHAEATMLETIAIGGIRARARRAAANLRSDSEALCARCGKAPLTVLHRY